MLELNQIYLMDCMEGMKQVPDKYFELAIVDPPYRDKNSPTEWMKVYQTGKEMFTTGKPDNEYFRELKRVSKEQIIFGANNFEYPYDGFLVWDKCVRGGKYSECEVASLSSGLSTLAKIVQMTVYNQDRIHPTQKPVKLYQWLLRNYAKQGDKILDTHMGSGSSIIACHDMGHEYMAFEIDKDYYAAACKRIEEHKAQIRMEL